LEAASLDWGLSGKSVIVTGASSGIGAAVARALGAVGASVLLAGRDEPRLGEQAQLVEKAGGKATVAQADLEDPEAAAGLVDRALEAYGSLHGIVQTASLFDPRPLSETTIDSIELQFRTNVTAPLAITQRAVPHLESGSSIVFVSSTTGTVGFPGCAAYSATKGAVESVARALAVELAPNGIRVNVVVPGYVRTPMLQPHLDANDGYEDWIVERTPVGYIGGPEELATTIIFLLSGLSTYVDGATLIADGGWTAQ
jgi:NAD(P)-dependent dehydrogenase (short-subunit alcohol dehydrogenase family)